MLLQLGRNLGRKGMRIDAVKLGGVLAQLGHEDAAAVANLEQPLRVRRQETYAQTKSLLLQPAEMRPVVPVGVVNWPGLDEILDLEQTQTSTSG